MRTLLLAAALVLGLPAAAQEDISKVNSSIRVEAGKAAGDLGTVNGGIRVGEGATAREVETVNGGIRLSRGAKVETAGTVNGGIELEETAFVERGIEAVNGGIELAPGAEAGGDVSNVNGGISVRGARIGGRIETVNGSVTVTAGAKVLGGIKVEKPGGWSWGKQRPPRIVIGPDSEVGGELVFEREVELYVHASAKVGPISGATPVRYEGANPPN
ncbi:MAG: hypothetical protein ACK59R_08015 [Pseudomonadota bacterium]